MCQELEIKDWNGIYNEIDPQLAYDNFYNKLFKLYDKNMPPVKIKNKRNNNSQKIPWITKGILKSRKTKNKLYSDFRRTMKQFLVVSL